jgi:hypothetical protein
MIFQKKNELITRKESYNLTQQVKVADVKQYLADEYERAFKREQEIDKLEREVKSLLEIKVKYDVLLIASDKNRERLLISEEKIAQLKKEIAELKNINMALKNTNSNIEINYNKELKQKDLKISELEKEIKKLSKKIRK